MQSPNSFLVLGIAVIAASTLGVSPAEAETSQRRPVTAAAESSSVSSASTTPRAEVEDPSQEVIQSPNADQVPRWQQPLQKGRLPKAPIQPIQGTTDLDQPQPSGSPEALAAASTPQAETSEPESLEPESLEIAEPEVSAPSSSQLRPNKSAKASSRSTSDAVAATPSSAAQPVEAEAVNETGNESANEPANEPSSGVSSSESSTASPTSQPVRESSADSDPALPSQPVDFGTGEGGNTAQTDTSAPVAPALQDAPVERPPQFLNNRLNNGLNSGFRLNSEPAPEYLYPNPNPLAFPTTTEEVEVVGTQPITLQQAIELAIRNNPEFRQAQFRLEQQQARVREVQASNFPTVGANASFNQQGQEQASTQPDTFTQNTLQGPVEIPNPRAGEVDVVYGDSTTLGTGISLNYDIYTSGRRPALIEAEQSEARRQQLEIERQLEELILETANDYYDLQSAGAQVNIFTATLAQAEQSLRDAQALERAGVGTRFDVLQAEVEVANTRQELTQQLSQLEIARRTLALRINLSEALDIAAADPIEVSGVWELSLEESIVQAYKNRVELEQALVQREVAQQRRRAALAQLGPQVSFNGDFNVVNDFDNDFTFLHNYSLGLTVRQSLYDGGAARSQANQQESEISVAEALFEQRREQIRFEVERAYSQLDANFSNIQTTALAVEQAAEALRLARLRFQAGVGTQTDVLRQQTELARAQVNNLQAIIGYNQAITSLQRAISNYPEGYLNEVP